jgi:5-methylcytosine-specific restriction protein A
MPNAPKKVNRPWVQQRKPFERERTADDFDYNGRKWRKLRASFLSKHPLCVMCESEGRATAATVVDHKVQVKLGGEGYDEDNLQSLCKKHHDSKSGRERHTGGMGSNL